MDLDEFLNTSCIVETQQSSPSSEKSEGKLPYE